MSLQIFHSFFMNLYKSVQYTVQKICIACDGDIAPRGSLKVYQHRRRVPMSLYMDQEACGFPCFNSGLIWKSFGLPAILEACGIHFPLIVRPYVDTFTGGHMDYFYFSIFVYFISVLQLLFRFYGHFQCLQQFRTCWSFQFFYVEYICEVAY